MARPPIIVIPNAFSIVFGAQAQPNRPASHLGEFLDVGMVWVPNSAFTTRVVQVDFGTPQPIDFAAMLNARGLAGPPRSDFRYFLLDAVPGPFSYASPIVPILDPVTSPARVLNSPFVEGTMTTARYLEAWVSNHPVNYDTFEAAFLVAGRKRTTARYAEHDWEVGIDDLSTVNFTRSGVPDIAAGAIMRTITFTLPWVSSDEYYEVIEPLDRAVGRRQPVFICFDPQPGPRRQALTYFGLLRENPRSRRRNAIAFERRFDMLSFI